MFGFGAKKAVVPPAEVQQGKKPLRFVADGQAIYMEGIEWPPVIADTVYASEDRCEFFRQIADSLNFTMRHRGRYNFILGKLQAALDGYNAGSKSAVDVKNDVAKIMQVLNNNPVE
jgi:hypothetical protein